MSRSILVIEPDENTRTQIGDALREQGYSVALAGEVSAAPLGHTPPGHAPPGHAAPDLVVVGAALAGAAAAAYPALPVIVLVPPGVSPPTEVPRCRGYVPAGPVPVTVLAATVELALRGPGPSPDPSPGTSPGPGEDLAFQFFFDNIPVAAIVSDRDYTVRHWNRGARELFGYSPEEVIGRDLMELLSSDRNDFSAASLKETLTATLRADHKSVNTNYDRTRDGRHILCEWYDFPYSSPHGDFILSVAQDITTEQELLDSLQAAVQQKEFLMQEIYHRLKNNLNMIISLIRLKIDEIEVRAPAAAAAAPEQPIPALAVDALEDIERKISAFSVLYEMLHQHKGDAASLDVRWYITELLGIVFSTMADEPCGTELDMEPLEVGPQTAVVLGLIVNEIATNAMKHGFVPGIPRVFRVALRVDTPAGTETAPGQPACHLALENTGRPFPADVDFDTTASLGLQLIQSLVQQLRGTVQLTREPATRYTIVFPLG